MSFDDRATRLAKVVAGKSLDIDQPLLKSVAISKAQTAQLSSAIVLYLWESVCAADPSFASPPSDDFFERHIDRIVQLPNITPNGLILPKIDNLHSYNIVHKVLAEIVRDLNIDRFVDRIHVPVNIRLVSGTRAASGDSRPRATTKPHSDIWAAEPAHALMLFIAVFGDLISTGIEFYEPASFPKELVRPLSDFNDGAAAMNGARRYPEILRTGQVVFSDPFLLHRTMNSGGRPRLSIDFRFLSRELLESDWYRDTPRIGNYIELDRWLEFGKSLMLVSHLRLREFRNDSGPVNQYGADYEWHKI